MNDEQIYQRGGTDEDVAWYARMNGADYTFIDSIIDDFRKTFGERDIIHGFDAVTCPYPDVGEWLYIKLSDAHRQWQIDMARKMGNAIINFTKEHAKMDDDEYVRHFIPSFESMRDFAVKFPDIAFTPTKETTNEK